MPSPAAAAELARSLLAPLGDRWQHTQGVAAEAVRLAATVPDEDRELLVVAAWWHDLGYAGEAVKTGFHALDGARFLVECGYPDRLCALVAHHSAAVVEAEERGLVAELTKWSHEDSPVSDALWTADMTTGPTGESVDYAARLAEILDRYEPESMVARAMTRARPQIEAVIARTQARLVTC